METPKNRNWKVLKSEYLRERQNICIQPTLVHRAQGGSGIAERKQDS